MVLSEVAERAIERHRLVLSLPRVEASNTTDFASGDRNRAFA